MPRSLRNADYGSLGLLSLTRENSAGEVYRKEMVHYLLVAILLTLCLVPEFARWRKKAKRADDHGTLGKRDNDSM